MILRTLQDFITSPTSFIVLDLKNKNIRDEDCAAIAEALPNAKHLKEIQLDCNYITGEGALKIANIAKDMPKIKQVNFEFNEISSEHIPQITDLLGDRCPSLSADIHPEHSAEERRPASSYHQLTVNTARLESKKESDKTDESPLYTGWPSDWPLAKGNIDDAVEALGDEAKEEECCE